MTPDALRALCRNSFFLSRAYGPVRNVDVETALGVTDEDFEALDSLWEETEPESEDDLVVRTIAVPIHLPGGHEWRVEVWDNGEDAGVTHRLCASDSNPVTIADIGAHPSGVDLRWSDASRLIAAARSDARNAPIADAVPLLLRSVIAFDASDDMARARDQLSQAWRAVGASSEATAELAGATSRSHGQRSSDEGADDAASDAREALARLIAAL